MKRLRVQVGGVDSGAREISGRPIMNVLPPVERQCIKIGGVDRSVQVAVTNEQRFRKSVLNGCLGKPFVAITVVDCAIAV